MPSAPRADTTRFASASSPWAVPTYLQDTAFFRDRDGGKAVCRTPWVVEAFLNGTCGAARRSRETGLWEDAYRSRRSDIALVRSLRDRRQVRRVSVHLLILHDELGLWREPTAYPTLPDIGCSHLARIRCRAA